MARTVHEAKTRVSWVPTISNIATPTVAELNAGTLLSHFITKDGLKVPANQNMVDNAALDEIFDAQEVGSFGGSLELTMFRDDTADTAWNLCVYGTHGYLVVRRQVDASTAWTVAQKVEVYPASMHQPIPQDTAPNEMNKFKEMLAVTSQPNLKATVA